MMKLDIQLFAYSQTILNNKKSTGLSPAAYYTVTAEPNNANNPNGNAKCPDGKYE